MPGTAGALRSARHAQPTGDCLLGGSPEMQWGPGHLPWHRKNLDSPTLISPWLGTISTCRETEKDKVQFKHTFKFLRMKPRAFIQNWGLPAHFKKEWREMVVWVTTIESTGPHLESRSGHGQTPPCGAASSITRCKVPGRSGVTSASSVSGP